MRRLETPLPMSGISNSNFLRADYRRSDARAPRHWGQPKLRGWQMCFLNPQEVRVSANGDLGAGEQRGSPYSHGS
jgi:hypothetical protein